MRSIGGCERFKGGGRKKEMNIVGMVFIQYNTMKKFNKLQLIDIINNFILMENVDLFNTRSSPNTSKALCSNLICYCTNATGNWTQRGIVYHATNKNIQ